MEELKKQNEAQAKRIKALEDCLWNVYGKVNSIKENIKSDPVEVPFANGVLKELQWIMNSLTKKSCATEIGYFQIEFFRYGCPNEYLIPLNYFWWCDTSVRFEASHLAEKYVEEQLKNRVKSTL